MSDCCCSKLIEELKGSDKKDCFSNKTTVSEYGKTFRIENKARKNICCVKIDNCLVTSTHTVRCDYMFKVCEENKYLLVELKGRAGIAHAIDQINSTYKIINDILKQPKEDFIGFIIASQVPGANQKQRNIIERKRSQSLIKIELSSQKKTMIV